jgi:OOP family OmpA-OmpF porin
MKSFNAPMFAILSSSLLLASAGAAMSADEGVTPAVQKVSVKGVAHFDFNKEGLNTDDGAKLMSEVRSMKNVTWQTILVTGHTDNIGSQDFNLKLSERRAQAVQAYLLEKGVKQEKIRTEAKGKLVPVASNKTTDGRAQNRRAEIEFVGLQMVAQQ